MPVTTASLPSLGGFTREAFERALPAGAPAWWLELKRSAYEKFSSLPFPRRTDETWRFSTLSGLSLEGYAPAEVVRSAALAASPFGPPALAFVNHRPTGPASLPAGLARSGAVVLPLSQALGEQSELLRRHFLAQPPKLGSDKFAALHAAFVADGAFVHIPRGVELKEPIVVLHAVAGDGAAVFPHTLVIAEENSKATVIDLFLSLDGASALAVGANDLFAGHGSQLTYVGVQDWSPRALSFQLNSTVVRRDARVQSTNVHLGGRQARHESLSQLQAPGAFSEMLALTAASGTQEFDQRTLQLHQAPDTRSDLLYKNTLQDRARTIFSGLIVVDPDAQRTDAYQSNRNLMLSDDAEANSLPGLEIQANDVRCTHGATTGPIDPEQKFYLQARGVSPAQADALLLFGFFEEVLNRLDDASLHDRLRAMLEARIKL